MAFSPQTFSVGQVLTAAQMNQVDSNIDAVRSQHANTSAPGDLTDGVMWLDTTDDTLKIRVDAAWVSLFSISGGAATPANQGTGTVWGQHLQTNDAASASEWAGPLMGFKNLIMNGGMDIWQRGTSLAALADAGAIADRWRWRKGAGVGVATFARIADAPTAELPNALQLDVTTADASLDASDFYGIEHLVEGLVARRLLWGTASARSATLSFWIKATSTGTYCVALQNSDRSRSYVAAVAVSGANTWERKEVTVSGDTAGTWLADTGVGLRITLCCGSGTTKQGTAGAWTGSDIRCTSAQQNIMDNVTGDLRTTGWQLELGLVATPLDLRPIQTELMLCYRYFWKTFLLDTTPATNAGQSGAECSRGTPSVSGNSGRSVWNFRPPTPMRATPTIVIYNPSAAANDQAYDINTSTSFGVAAYVVSARHWQIRTSSAVGNPAEAAGIVHCTADAELS